MVIWKFSCNIFKQVEFEIHALPEWLSWILSLRRRLRHKKKLSHLRIRMKLRTCLRLVKSTQWWVAAAPRGSPAALRKRVDSRRQPPPAASFSALCCSYRFWSVYITVGTGTKEKKRWKPTNLEKNWWQKSGLHLSDEDPRRIQRVALKSRPEVGRKADGSREQRLNPEPR